MKLCLGCAPFYRQDRVKFQLKFTSNYVVILRAAIFPEAGFAGDGMDGELRFKDHNV